jgi:hypothetical protein
MERRSASSGRCINSAVAVESMGAPPAAGEVAGGECLGVLSFEGQSILLLI